MASLGGQGRPENEMRERLQKSAEREGIPHSAGRNGAHGSVRRTGGKLGEEDPSRSWGAYPHVPQSQQPSHYRSSMMEGASSGSHLGSDQSASTSHHGYLGSDPLAFYQLQQRASLSLMHQVALDHGPRSVPPASYGRFGPWLYAGNGGDSWDYASNSHPREMPSYYDMPPRYYDNSWGYNDAREYSPWRSMVDPEASASGGVASTSQIPGGMGFERGTKSPRPGQPGKYNSLPPGVPFQDQRNRQQLPSRGSKAYASSDDVPAQTVGGDQGSESPESPAPPAPEKSHTRVSPQCTKPSNLPGSPSAGTQKCINAYAVRNNRGEVMMDMDNKPITDHCPHEYKRLVSNPSAQPAGAREAAVKPSASRPEIRREATELIPTRPSQAEPKRPSVSASVTVQKRPASVPKPFTPPKARPPNARPPNAIGLPGASSTEQPTKPSEAAAAVRKAQKGAETAALRKAQKASKARVHVNSVANLQRTKECPVCKMTYGNKMGGKEGGSRCTNMITARDGNGSIIHDQHGNALTQQCPHVFMSTAQTLLMKRKAEAMSSDLRDKGLKSKPQKLMHVEAEFWKVVQKLEKDLPKLGGGDVFVALVALVTPCNAQPSKNLRLATRTLSDGSVMRLALLRAFTGKYSEMVFHDKNGDYEATDKSLNALLNELVAAREEQLQEEAKRRKLETETAAISSSDLRSFLVSIGLEEMHDSLKAKEFDLDTLVMGSVSESNPSMPGMITTEFLCENIGIPEVAAEQIMEYASKIRRVQLLKE